MKHAVATNKQTIVPPDQTIQQSNNTTHLQHLYHSLKQQTSKTKNQIPSTPISYTRRKRQQEQEPPDHYLGLVINAATIAPRLDLQKIRHAKKEACSSVPTTFRPLSVRSSVTDCNSVQQQQHAYLASLLPPSKPTIPSQAQEEQAVPSSMQHTVSQFVHTYKQQVNHIKDRSAKIWRRHFKTNPVFAWQDAKVNMLDKQIYDSTQRVAEQEAQHQRQLDLIKAQMNRQAIRESFKVQQQKNLLGRVMVPELRIVSQLADLHHGAAAPISQPSAPSGTKPSNRPRSAPHSRSAISNSQSTNVYECTAHKAFGTLRDEFYDEVSRFELKLKGFC